jgi:hypothetical protein
LAYDALCVDGLTFSIILIKAASDAACIFFMARLR